MSAYSIENTILLDVSPESPLIEGELHSPAIFPGMFVEERVPVAGSSLPKIYTANNPDSVVEKFVIVENLQEGKTIEYEYLVGERVPMRVLRSGDIFLAMIHTTSTSDVSWGMVLVPFGGGFLHDDPGGTESGSVVAVAIENIIAPTFPVLARCRAV
jgi:hypothetical protein